MSLRVCLSPCSGMSIECELIACLLWTQWCLNSLAGCISRRWVCLLGRVKLSKTIFNPSCGVVDERIPPNISFFLHVKGRHPYCKIYGCVIFRWCHRDVDQDPCAEDWLCHGVSMYPTYWHCLNVLFWTQWGYYFPGVWYDLHIEKYHHHDVS